MKTLKAFLYKHHLKLIPVLLLIMTLFLTNSAVLAQDTCVEVNGVFRVNGDADGAACIGINEGDDGIGFSIPSLSDILTFAVRFVFVAGGLAALVMLLLGAVSYITSGGDKEKTKGAQDKIQAAVVGVILIAVVLAIVVTLEQVIFGGNICLGLSCPITIPALIKD